MEELFSLFETVKTEYDKFQQGNKSAGTRARVTENKSKSPRT